MTLGLYVANAIYLTSYAVRDIFWLRLLAAVASVVTMINLLLGGASWEIWMWQTVFFAINTARFVQVVRERRPVPLSPDARRLSATVFRGLRGRELMRLLAVGEAIDHAVGASLVKRGEKVTHLAVVVDGTARVELADQRTVELAHGKFIGELCYLTGKPAAADVVAATALRVVRWPVDALKAFLAANDESRTAVQLVLGADLAAKLRG